MMTGGQENPNTGSDGTGLNAAGVRGRAPRSKGVTPNMNLSATVVPGGQPSKMYGGKMKKGGTAKTKMMYGGMKKMGKKK